MSQVSILIIEIVNFRRGLLWADCVQFRYSDNEFHMSTEESRSTYEYVTSNLCPPMELES